MKLISIPSQAGVADARSSPLEPGASAALGPSARFR
jgi:hypothetical protein